MVNPKGGNNTGHVMAATTRSGKGANAPTSSQRKLVDDEKVEQEDETLNNVVQALNKLNLDWDVAANLRVAHLNGLDEFRHHVYTSSSLYKEKMKYLHDNYIWHREFKEGDLVLLFNSCLRMFLEKLKPKWNGPFEVVGVTPFGELDLENKNNEVFRVTGHRVKHYLGKVGDGHVVAAIHFK
uniref:Uncharacterized protein n=1 Tax=Nicotiana tabacum TaxID=4097 RepID=A0A1S4CGC0_TOBAC|nr:PREDICTED: uncharacterized protein LOC107818704 [Nicotiana tabacum]